MRGLARTIRVIDAINIHAGRWTMWLAVIMAVVQFAVVIMRYVFSVGFIPLQESIWYFHGILFMMGAGFTLLQDGHVRVDVFYREARPRTKAWVDLLGAVFFLIPLCIATFYLSFTYVINSWAVFEGSTEISGLPLIFLLKTVIWAFAILVGLQGVALAARAMITLRGDGKTYSAAGITGGGGH